MIMAEKRQAGAARPQRTGLPTVSPRHARTSVVAQSKRAACGMLGGRYDVRPPISLGGRH
jgi:hypothetical protein